MKRAVRVSSKLKCATATIYKDRRKIYSQANYKINCNGKNKDEVVKNIKEIYDNI